MRTRTSPQEKKNSLPLFIDHTTMEQYIILLRGINVGGIKVLMKDLKNELEKMGYTHILTYIQTGNIILHAPKDTAIILEQAIHKMLFEKFQYQIEVFVGNRATLAKAIAINPFRDDATINQDKVYFALTKGKITDDLWKSFQAIDHGEEQYYYIEDFLFWYSPYSFSDSKLNNNYFENKLKIKATTRNMKTIRKLVALSENT